MRGQGQLPRGPDLCGLRDLTTAQSMRGFKEAHRRSTMRGVIWDVLEAGLWAWVVYWLVWGGR